MASILLDLNDHGEISIPAHIRQRWQGQRLLLVDGGDTITLRPVPDEPAAAVDGKYAWLEADSVTIRADERAADLEREARR